MKFIIKSFKRIIFILFSVIILQQSVFPHNIKYIGFDIHGVLLHLNLEKGPTRPLDYQTIVISITEKLNNEYQVGQEQFGVIAERIGVLMKKSIPILIPQLLQWVSTAAEESELGKMWFSKHFTVTEEQIRESTEQIVKSDEYNKFVDQILYNSLNTGISELADKLNNDQDSVETTLIRILKNGLIKNISNMVVNGFYNITSHARMAEPTKSMPKLLKILKNKGFSLFIISNAASEIVNEQYKQKPELAELFQYFEDGKIIVSGEVGLKKPDPAIFEFAAKKIGFKFSECLFVDDEQPIITAANKLGITGILFDRSRIGEFLEVLKKMSVINDADLEEILGVK